MRRLGSQILTVLAMLACGCGNEEKRAAPVVPSPPEPARIIQFYVFPQVVERGADAQLCYGVSGVKRVTIEPGFPEAPAFLNRCVTVSSHRNTEYVLTAWGANGERLIRKVALTVQPKRSAAPKPSLPAPPAGPAITSFTASPAEAERGNAVNFCYETSGASSVRIDPPILSFRLPARGCFGYVPEKSSTYTLSASAGGSEVRKQVTVTVR